MNFFFPYMKIIKNTVVSLNYTLSDNDGNIIEKSEEPMIYLHGGYENTLPKIESALEGKEVGEEILVYLEPSESFGEYDAELVRTEDLKNLPEDIAIGMEIEGDDELDEDDEPLIFTITDIAEGKAVLDGNHPLAGLSLRFTASVIDVREASTVEIEHQHVHFDDEEDDGGDDAASHGEHYRSHRLH